MTTATRAASDDAELTLDPGAASPSDAPSRRWATLRRDLGRIASLAKPHWAGLLVATLSLALGSGIGLLYPQAARLTIDEVIKGQGVAGLDLTTIGLGLLGLFALQAVFVSLRYYLFTVIGDRIVTDLRHALYGAILAQEMGFFDERKTGELTSRLASDTQVLQNAVTSNMSMTLRYGAQALGGVILLFVTSPKLSLVIVVALPLVLGVAKLYGRKVRALSRQVQDALADSTAIAEESLSGVRTVRSFAREAHERARYGQAVERSFGLARERARQGALFGGGMSFLAYGALALVLWLGSLMVMRQELSAGDLTAFLLYAFMVAMALGILSGLYTDLMKALGASERVFSLLDRSPAQRTSDQPLPHGPTRGQVELRQVTFAYPTRQEVRALDEVSLSLEPGQRLALVGHSGSGKSTIASLLSRFYDPTQGQILIDGQPIERYDVDALRESIGVVAQEPTLFSGTIRSNVSYGRPQASTDQIIDALKAANAWEFIERLPEGLDTVIGERGLRLSGGQKQRVAIARALLKDPKILLLDEATSALDVESEALVQRALEHLMRGRTTIIIAHRLSTIRHADQVVVLERGRVIERGDHASLLAQGGAYARMIEHQQWPDQPASSP